MAHAKKKSEEVEEFEAGDEQAAGPSAAPSSETAAPPSPASDVFVNPADGRKYRRRHELVGDRWLDWSEPAE